jgi:hypothetical protein
MKNAASSALFSILLGLPMAFTPLQAGGGGGSGAGSYTEGQVFQSRPDPTRDSFFGGVGVTGLMLRVSPGVILQVESITPGSPADGKFAKGETITAVNGTNLKGINPFVALGNALTRAEATDGRMVFDVISSDGKTTRKESLAIPVVGAYSKTWPLDCAKSKRIIADAAAFYSDPKKFKDGGIPGALACLFLLSTGDDQYLPRVKAYFDGFPKDVRGIGEHTWNNGYNGIACAEYYLRTGDTSVLPILQYFCDDAKARQKFGRGWTHWSNEINPGYVAGGLMNPAGAQVLTTLLLGKECGVNVDEETLLGALRFFYRFAGHGTVAYGDHRGEGGLGSNGKDGMIAAAMKIAAGAKGDTTAYKMASQYLAMSMIDSYPLLVQGHGDDGRGDGIWRAITTSYLMEEKPALFRESMDRLTWWHDLSREPGGSIGIGTLVWGGGKVGSSGPGIAISYTAPLRTLRITGAPRSEFSKDFTLPETIWGTAADKAFLSIEHHPKYFEYGPEEPAHVPFYALGGAYHKPEKDLKSLPRETILRNVYHRNYMIRAQAGKALREVDAMDELEKLLGDSDPRVRRAALDGLIDYNYWFGIGRNPIAADKFTPGMLEKITKLISDPAEAWYVVDGALMALKFAPTAEIKARLPHILPWTKHTDWWLREAAFMAISGLEKDDKLYLGVLPTLLDVAQREYHTQPRERMIAHLHGALKRKTPASDAGKLIVAGLENAIAGSEIKSGPRAPEGAFNVLQAVKVCLESDPTSAIAVAGLVRERMNDFSTADLVALVASPNANPEGRPYGLLTTLDKLPTERQHELKGILFDIYRPELIRRMESETGEKQALTDTIIDLTRLRNPSAGWKPLGKVPPAERVWRFVSFDPKTEQDRLHPREKRRFRDIELPENLKDWHKPEYDDSPWNQGRAPIGIGDFKQGGVSFANQSDWGKGEFMVMRTTFEVDALDCDAYRLNILARQGFRVFLNGQEIHTYVWWKDMPHYRPIDLTPNQVKLIKTGTNVLAAYANVEYAQNSQAPSGQMDFHIEGLKMSDLK